MKWKQVLCMVIVSVVVMGGGVRSRGEGLGERVERVYPSWQEDYEEWNNKSLLNGYDVEKKALVAAVIEHESRFQGDVGTQYRGLMQISTSKDVLNFVGVSADSLYDEKTNIKCGTRMLEYYLDKSEGNIERALCMYGCGEGASKKRKTYCRTGQEIYILYGKYKNLFEQEEMNSFLLEEIEDRKLELDSLIELTESANSKLRGYYKLRVNNVEKEIAKLEEMLG